jgi:glutamate transport system substrate-binding protein
MSFRKLAAVLLAGGLALAACGQQAPLGSSGASAPPVASGATFPEGSAMARLASAGTVRVGTKFDQPLFGLKGLDGKPVGFDVEIAKIVVAKLGIPADKITYTETPSKIREDVIANDQVDMVVATYTINDARKQKVSFAGPYYVAGQDLMVKADNTTITGPESLKGANARVCSVSGSTPAKEITKYVDQANIVLFDVYSKCADALRNGQIEAVTTDNVILSGLVSTSQGAFKLVNKPFTKEPYGIGIKKGDTAFCQFIDDALKASASDGTYAAAWKATVGTVQPDVPQLPTADACS